MFGGRASTGKRWGAGVAGGFHEVGGGRKGPEEGAGDVKAVWAAVGWGGRQGHGEPQRAATRDSGFEICDVPSPLLAVTV